MRHRATKGCNILLCNLFTVQVHVTEGASEALHPDFIHQAWACALTQGFTDKRKGTLKKHLLKAVM